MTTKSTHSVTGSQLKAEEELVAEHLAALGEEPTIDRVIEVKLQFKDRVEQLQINRFRHMSTHEKVDGKTAMYSGIGVIEDYLDQNAVALMEKQKLKVLSEKYEEHRDVEEWDVGVIGPQQEMTVTIDKFDGLPNGSVDSPEDAQIARTVNNILVAATPHFPPRGNRADYLRQLAISQAINTAYGSSNLGYGLSFKDSSPNSYFEVTVVPSERAIRLKDAQKHVNRTVLIEGWL